MLELLLQLHVLLLLLMHRLHLHAQLFRHLRERVPRPGGGGQSSEPQWLEHGRALFIARVGLGVRGEGMGLGGARAKRRPYGVRDDRDAETDLEHVV